MDYGVTNEIGPPKRCTGQQLQSCMPRWNLSFPKRSVLKKKEEKRKGGKLNLSSTLFQPLVEDQTQFLILNFSDSVTTDHKEKPTLPAI